MWPVVTLLAKSKYLRDKELKNEKAMVQKVHGTKISLYFIKYKLSKKIIIAVALNIMQILK